MNHERKAALDFRLWSTRQSTISASPPTSGTPPRNLDPLTTQILALDKCLQRHVRQDAVAQRLQTIPGVGTFGALLLQAEIGPAARFRSAQQLAAYAGLVPSTHSSGGKTRHGTIERASPWLKCIRGGILQTLKSLTWLRQLSRGGVVPQDVQKHV